MIGRIAFLLTLVAAWPAAAEVIVLQPGHYDALHINGQHDVTYRCASPGACTMGSGTTIKNSDGVTIDGFDFNGGSMGITIDGSDNVTVTRSTFTSQGSSGILVNPGSTSHNIRIIDNDFVNNKTGCNKVDPGNCSGHLADGSPVSYMDYGVRVYSADGILIQGNTFGTLFNHAISFKSDVEGGRIIGNEFNSCGRTCIELGQESHVGCTTVQDNAFSGSTMHAIMLKSIDCTDIANNRTHITGVWLADWSNGGADNGGGGGGEPPYVYVPPVVEDAAARYERILAEGSAGADARRLQVVGEGPPVHNCCDDPNNPIDPGVMQRLKKIQGQPGVDWMR